MVRQVGTYIPGNSPMAHSIHAVWSKSYLINNVTERLKILFCSCTNFCIRRQYHNPLVGSYHSYFIFSTYHPKAFHPTDLGNFHSQWFTSGWIDGGANCGYYHFLAGGNVWCPANYL